MHHRRFVVLGWVLAALAFGAAFPGTALAGLPMICHPFDIGGAKSLPWSDNAMSVNENYDVSRLAGDTLALLTSVTPVVVRMETLRRAALYAKKDPLVEKELLLKLRARAFDAESQGKPDALAWFDAGYFVETLKQRDMTFRRLPDGSSEPVYHANVARNIDGYAWVGKALTLSGDDPAMEFAAAIMTSWPRQASHDEHLRKAVAGATEGSLLAKNLLSHYGDQGKTIAELREKLAAR